MSLALESAGALGVCMHDTFVVQGRHQHRPAAWPLAASTAACKGSCPASQVLHKLSLWLLHCRFQFVYNGAWYDLHDGFSQLLAEFFVENKAMFNNQRTIHIILIVVMVSIAE